ncbi:extracellular tyrosine-protein kinase PKDCC-like [Bacillus rossius redtenbacheri]|uniref:extracellular tyrosine-protein kinase PKDCC-like n=1 Tax=Bacillus rossius redtenbacheri TaxID=93214 RepID=UPI002FDE0030
MARRSARPCASGLCVFVSVYAGLFAVAGVVLFGSLPQLRREEAPQGEQGSHGLAWPRANLSRWPAGELDCAALQEARDLEFVAAGWTKAVYRARLRGRQVAVKTVNLNGHDIRECLKRAGATLPACYRRAAAKILKEIILLTELRHDHVIQVLGSCVPDAVGPVAMVTELGDPLDTVRLLQLSWEDRLRLALGTAHILHHLAHSPLGSLAMNDFRRQQFVLVGGALKLSDVDDMSLGEPACASDLDCAAPQLNATPRLRCKEARCEGHNERLNIWHAGRHLVRQLLPLSAPASLEPLVQELVAAYSRPGAWDSARILAATRGLVGRFVSGRYLAARPPPPGVAGLGFQVVADSDLPGQFDYRCHDSTSAVGCVASVFDEREAAERCARDEACRAVVLGRDHTWTGRTIAIFKNGYGPPSTRQGFSLLVKKPAA